MQNILSYIVYIYKSCFISYWFFYQYLLFVFFEKAWPRGAALAEATWSGRHRPGFGDFQRRLELLQPELRRMQAERQKNGRNPGFFWEKDGNMVQKCWFKSSFL